jgi:hypothetical protein
VTDHCAEVVAAHNDIDHLMQFGRASMIPLGLRVLLFARACSPNSDLPFPGVAHGPLSGQV